MTDTNYIIAFGFFIAFIVFITGLIQTTNAEFKIIDNFDIAWLGSSFLAVAGVCVIATGLPCASALGFFAFANFFVLNSVMVWVIFTPLTLGIAYIIAKLGRGTR